MYSVLLLFCCVKTVDESVDPIINRWSFKSDILSWIIRWHCTVWVSILEKKWNTLFGVFYLLISHCITTIQYNDVLQQYNTMANQQINRWSFICWLADKYDVNNTLPVEKKDTRSANNKTIYSSNFPFWINSSCSITSSIFIHTREDRWILKGLGL